MVLIKSTASASEGGGIVDKTHAEMLALVAASGFTPGQMYRITDFRTHIVIPNTLVDLYGPTEPLIVMAATAAKLHHEAVSETWPQDFICYELVDTFPAYKYGDRGRIYFRRDTLLWIETPEDWRAIKYRRWETSPASGIFTVLTDNGGAYVDKYMFNDSAAAATCSDITIGPCHSLINSVFGPWAYGLRIGQEFYDNTISSSFNDNTIGDSFYQNTIGSSFYLNTVGKAFVGNTVGNSCYENTFGIDFSSNMVGDNFRRNWVGNRISGQTFPSNMWDQHRSSRRLFQAAPATAPTDADLTNGSISIYLDEAGNNIMIRVRKSDGTYRTATISTA